jgi:predicted HTH transcriptional regulator
MLFLASACATTGRGNKATEPVRAQHALGVQRILILAVSFPEIELERSLEQIREHVLERTAIYYARATYELPPDAVGEAIVNAIAHRDYHSNASVEVRLFTDRLEVWNPGRLPGTLTLDDLRNDHPSVPNNPLIAESLYLTRYIEKAGSGTQRMIELCRSAGLPEPQFEQRSGSFVITLWRDWLTDKVLAELDLNNRQVQAVEYVKSHERITNAEYQRVTGAPQRTATRDLNELVQKGVLELEGKGRGAQYRFLQKRARNAPNAPSEDI